MVSAWATTVDSTDANAAIASVIINDFIVGAPALLFGGSWIGPAGPSDSRLELLMRGRGISFLRFS
jgi:hypothetical protein